MTDGVPVTGPDLFFTKRILLSRIVVALVFFSVDTDIGPTKKKTEKTYGELVN